MGVLVPAENGEVEAKGERRFPIRTARVMPSGSTWWLVT